MSEFKKGDLVQLKSGGPVMTVQSVGPYVSSGGPEDGVFCVWFDTVKGTQKDYDRVFDAATLQMHRPRAIGASSVNRRGSY